MELSRTNRWTCPRSDTRSESYSWRSVHRIGVLIFPDLRFGVDKPWVTWLWNSPAAERRPGPVLRRDRSIDRLADTHKSLPKIVFLGKFGRMRLDHSGVYILIRASRWNAPIRLLCHCDQPAAMTWLTDHNCLAVMPAIMDNSPYTVAECLSIGIPFIARDVGCGSEMIEPADRNRCLVGDNPAGRTRAIDA